MCALSQESVLRSEFDTSSPRKSLSLRANFAWTFGGNLVYAACQWGILSALARSGGPSMVGRFALGLAITAPVMIQASLNLRAVLATDVEDDYEFPDYLALRLLTTVLAIVVTAAISQIANYRREVQFTIIGISVAKGVEAISDIFLGYLQKTERMDKIAISMASKGILSLAAILVGVHLTGSIEGAVLGLILAWTTVLLVYDIPQFAKCATPASGFMSTRARLMPILSQPVNWKGLRQLAFRSLPLGFTLMLLSLNVNVPRYFVERFLGERELGFFSAMAYFVVAGTSVTTALGQSATPRLARLYILDDRSKFRSLLWKLVLIGTSLGVLGVLVAKLAGEPLLRLVYGAEYGQYADVFVWIMVAAGASYVGSFLGYGVTATRAFSLFFTRYLFMVIITVIASALLIPKWGLRGAAWATLVAGVSSCIAPLLILRAKRRE